MVYIIECSWMPYRNPLKLDRNQIESGFSSAEIECVVDNKWRNWGIVIK